MIAQLQALLNQRDFQVGMALGYTYFSEDHEERALTEEEIVEEIDNSVSPYALEVTNRADRALGLAQKHILQHLGFVIGTIARGLAYEEEDRVKASSSSPSPLPVVPVLTPPNAPVWT